MTEQRDATAPAVLDVAELVALIRALWAERLGHSDFTDDESFFAVGGHSMRAVLVMKALGVAVGAKLPTRMLLDNQTINELTDAVRAHVASE
jgi:acyl carrier protein